MLKLGINLWFKNSNNISELLAKAKAIGLDHVEISLDYPFGVYDKEPFYRMARISRDFGFTLSIHAPWQEIHLASPLDEIRRAALEITKKAIIESYRVEAHYLVIHVTSEQGICKVKPLRENPCIKAAINSLEEILSYAEDHGIYIAIENVGYPCCGRIDFYSHIVSETSALACLDIAHAIAMDKELSKKPEEVEYADVVREWSNAIGIEKVFSLHVHGIRKNSNGKIDEHVDLDSNHIDVKKIVKFLGRNLRYVVFEIFKRSDGSDFDIIELKPIIREFRSWAAAYGI